MSPSESACLPQPSAHASLLKTHPPHPAQHPLLHAVAITVLHNLRHQHNWSALRLHNVSPITSRPLSRPLVSGLPPRRVYVHPDEQIEEIKQGLKEEDACVERMWVLPTRLNEKWTLGKFGRLFDAIGAAPKEQGDGIEEIGESDLSEQGHESRQEDQALLAMKDDDQQREENGERPVPKRLLLAIVGDDSTVVYYIVHDGIVKPRQN